jgi:lycopene cyclase domain-containing protein
MSYTQAAVVAVCVVVVVDVLVLRTRLIRRRAFWTAEAIIVACQLVVNGILTGRGVVRYSSDAILGWRVAYAPVEDLLFGFALSLLTLALWVSAGRSASAAGASANDTRREATTK